MSIDLAIRVASLPGPKLVRDYLSGESSALAFFRGSPLSLETYREALPELQSQFGRAERERAAAALRPTSPLAAERLARFVEEGGAVVTTGQQTGLFTGPLYTIHKILGAVTLAEALERELRILVLPVFWSASEDHDWAEVNHAWMFGPRENLRRIGLADGEARAVPMSNRLLGSGIESVEENLSHLLGGYQFAPDYLRLVEGAYQPGRSVSGAFRDVVEALFEPFHLLTTDAADPALKRESASVMRRALAGAAEHEAVLRVASQRLQQEGYHAQVNLVPGAANLFLHTEAGRERLHRSAQGWRTRVSRRIFSDEEVNALISKAPGRVSPNVFLRPVVERAVFPVLAYVAGPGEISYFAQIHDLYSCFGISPPIVFPRPSVTLAPSELEAALADLGFNVSDLTAPESELSTQLARRLVPAAVFEAVEMLRSSTVGGYRALLGTVPDPDGSVERALGRLRNRALRDLREAERSVVHHTKEQEAARMQLLARARAVLRPRGEPQERVLNILPFLARYGPTLLDGIASAIRSDLAERMA